MNDQQLGEEFRRDGCVIFRRIVPASLIRDLRIVADKARDIARHEGGPQVQRLQPLADHDLDRSVLRSFLELPALVDALRSIVGPAVQPTTSFAGLGMLFEPACRPWCLAWHRDWRDNTRVDQSFWRRHRSDGAYFNQMNCALYEDDCTWYVPGSQDREDTDGELARPPEPSLEGLDEVTAELRCRDYCRAMPGAICVRLEPGDYLLYRSTGWHLGSYVPYRRRATLHDFVDTSAYANWRERALRSVEIA